MQEVFGCFFHISVKIIDEKIIFSQTENLKYIFKHTLINKDVDNRNLCDWEVKVHKLIYQDIINTKRSPQTFLTGLCKCRAQGKFINWIKAYKENLTKKKYWEWSQQLWCENCRTL